MLQFSLKTWIPGNIFGCQLRLMPPKNITNHQDVYKEWNPLVSHNPHCNGFAIQEMQPRPSQKFPVRRCMLWFIPLIFGWIYLVSHYLYHHRGLCNPNSLLHLYVKQYYRGLLVNSDVFVAHNTNTYIFLHFTDKHHLHWKCVWAQIHLSTRVSSPKLELY